MLESFNVPGIYIALQPFLSLFAAGKFYGIVVELGEDLSQFVPIFDGFESNYNYRKFLILSNTKIDGIKDYD